MADTRKDAVDRIVAGVAELGLDELVMWHCYHQFSEDDAAQDACRPATMQATQSLIADLPTLAEELTAPAFLPTRAKEDRTGGSRFGGVPDVPAGFDWPLSAHYTIGDAYGVYAPTSFRQLLQRKKPLPMTFMAQIALAEVAGLDPDLPEDGRLLIFMDYGMWFEGDASGLRILWDRSADAGLTPATAPDTLARFDALARAQDEALQKETDALMETMEGFFEDLDLESMGPDDDTDTRDDEADDDYVEEEEETFSSPFLPPRTPVTFAQSWLRLDHHAAEVKSTAYAKRVEAVDVVFEADAPVTEAGETPPYHQVLGKPWPEQDDPRYEAVKQRILGRPYGSREDYALMKHKTGLATDDEMAAHIEAEAQAYVLLLQLDVASFIDMNEEGTFYLLLHRDDLKARRFDDAIVIYQQT